VNATSERPYSNPYRVGVCLGLVLLASFLVAGRGLGAIGAFAGAAAGVTQAVAPAAASNSPVVQRHLAVPGGAWRNWLLVELAGVVLGGGLSAAWGRRLRWAVERGDRISPPERLAVAFGGGAVMGVGALLARGCTSGQALTGGALLSVGSWVFVAAVFVAAYAVSPLLGRVWR
jgi:uncharacterized membrane protein YedE/YeeE